jgi:hypothetical protein
VDPLRAQSRPVEREVDGILGALDDLVVVALAQPDGGVAEHVHGGDDVDRQVEPHVRMLAC